MRELGLGVPVAYIVLTVTSRAGLALVAIGFERFVELAHERTRAHQSRSCLVRFAR